MKTNLLICAVAVAVILGGCGGKKRDQREGAIYPFVQFPTGTSAPVKSTAGGVVTASLDPASNNTQLIGGAAGSAVEGVTVAFPPGSLGIAVDVSVRSGQTQSSEQIGSELGVSSTLKVTGSATPVVVTASSSIDLLQPMTLALPMPTVAGLAGEDYTSRIAVYYKVKKESAGELVAGLVPRKDLVINNGKVLHSTMHFGVFQTIITSEEVTAAIEVKATTPLQRYPMFLATGVPVPSCGQSDTGLLVYSEEESTFKVCGATGWTNLDLRGATGATGATGPTGATGATGAAGADAQALSVFNASGTKIGGFGGFTGSSGMIEKVLISFSSGAVGYFWLTDGVYAGPICANGWCDTCRYTTTDCTGTCYSNNFRPSGVKPIKGTLIYAAPTAATAGLYAATGVNTVQTGTTVTVNSYYSYARTEEPSAGCWTQTATDITDPLVPGVDTTNLIVPAASLPLAGPLGVGK